MKQPTTYLSPEECVIGEGLRCLHDPRFFHVPEPDPLPVALFAEIEAALARRTCECVRVLQIGANTLDNIVMSCYYQYRQQVVVKNGKRVKEWQIK